MLGPIFSGLVGHRVVRHADIALHGNICEAVGTTGPADDSKTGVGRRLVAARLALGRLRCLARPRSQSNQLWLPVSGHRFPFREAEESLLIANNILQISKAVKLLEFINHILALDDLPLVLFCKFIELR